MTLTDVLNDDSPIGQRPLTTLKAQLAVIRAAKFWRGPYFAIDAEVQKRVTSIWVKEDVFGHTFTGN